MKKLILPLVMAATAGMANAEAPKGVYVPFGVMGYDYDESTRVLDNDVLPTLGIGYRFDQNWAAEVMAADGSTDIDVPGNGAGDADVRHYRLDGLYFMNDMGGLTPYAVAGVGANRVDYGRAGGTDEDGLLNAGVGLLFQATDNFAVRGDVRAIHSLDDYNTEAAVNLLAQFNFGSSSKPVAPVAPPADDDKDGVVNTKDRCPTTPPNKTVDKNGCDCNYALHLGFEFDSAELHADDFAILDRLSTVIEDLGYVHANVVGHTDSMGEEAYNQELSLRRAQAVADYFASKGLNKEMFTPSGRGETEAVADNSTEAGRADNRRVMIERDDCGK